MSNFSRISPVCARLLHRQANVTQPRTIPLCRQQYTTFSNHERSRKVGKAMVVFGTSAVLGFSAVNMVKYLNKFSPSNPMPKVDAAEPTIGHRRKTMNFLADVVDLAAPAVVHLEVQTKHIFTGDMVSTSSGSGFIVRQDGLIVTNAHVVSNQSHVRVRLHDGRTLDGVVQAIDPQSDLATVKVNATGLPVLPMGKSSELRPGEFVVAMGSPFSLNNTVTSGIISSISRKSVELGLARDREMAYLQTDAIINVGNSGGPLVNLDGEAIGVNTMNLTTGISFAIPSDYVAGFLEKALKLEKRTQGSGGGGWFNRTSQQKPKTVQSLRRYMGVTMLSLTPDLIKDLRTRGRGVHLPESLTYGVLVYSVTQGSPAHRAGILPGDVITAIDGKPVVSSNDVYSALEDDSRASLGVSVQREAGERVIDITPVSHEIK